jgi:hypothetical protein
MCPEPTPLNKPRSTRSLNAYRHGLTGQIYLMTPADEHAYKKHCQDILRSLAPVGGMEVELAQAICDDRWRLKSAAAWEKAILADGITESDTVRSNFEEVDAALAHGRVWIAQGKNLVLLSLYEHRMQRRVEKNMQMLRDLQAQRKTATDEVISQVDLLSRSAENEGEAFDPESDYPVALLYPQFDFSMSNILGRVAHRRRLSDAAKSALS